MTEVYQCDNCGKTIPHHNAGPRDNWIVSQSCHDIELWIAKGKVDTTFRKLHFCGKQFCCLECLLEWIKKQVTS